MRLFLIRHGETVDNVAQVYAGSRDSELTNHGYQQAKRLGQHFRSLDLTFTHIFSSHLQRASTTANLIRDAQVLDASDRETTITVPDVIQLPMLMEQDFGYYEGKKWYEGPANNRPRQDPGFVDMETNDAMMRRASTFLETHLFPLLHDPNAQQHVVAIVSHGILLSVLWKSMLARLPANSVRLAPDLPRLPSLSLERLGGWSNTGYLELHLQRHKSAVRAKQSGSEQPDSVTAKAMHEGPDTSPSTEGTHAPAPLQSVVPPQGWITTIRTINGRDHLKNLKRTGGGVGSAKHDATQKSIETFFKRRKTE